MINKDNKTITMKKFAILTVLFLTTATLTTLASDPYFHRSSKPVSQKTLGAPLDGGLLLLLGGAGAAFYTARKQRANEEE